MLTAIKNWLQSPEQNKPLQLKPVIDEMVANALDKDVYAKRNVLFQLMIQKDYQYVTKQFEAFIAKGELFEPHNDLPLLSRTHWTEEYMQLSYALLKQNFSMERFFHTLDVIRKVKLETLREGES